MDRDRRELADDQVLRPERVRRCLVRRELLDGNHVRSDHGRCRDVFRRDHGRHVLRPSNRYRAARGSANEQGPSERHNGKENTEDQEDAVALRLNLRRQSTHLLILGASAPRRDAPSGHVSISERSSLRDREKEREPACAGSLWLLPRTTGLLAEAARNVAEHVLDLVAENDQDYDDNHRDQDENEGVLYHALPFLTVEQLTEAQIKVGQHANSPPCGADRTDPVSHEAAYGSTHTPQKNGQQVLTNR